jgi:hypothetical protein
LLSGLPILFSLAPPPNLDIEPTSPADNAGTNFGSAVVGTVDFAGNPRVQGSATDIGAYEE